MVFKDRTAAGQQLGQQLSQYANRPDVLVLGLPRGGVPVAFEVAKALNAPLDVFMVRKLGVPGHEELAMGAIASGGIRVLNDEVIRGLNLSNDVIDRVAANEQQELERRERLYREGHRDRQMAPTPAATVDGTTEGDRFSSRTIILVDDGLATGATMRAAVEALRQKHPAELIVAVPVASSKTCQEFEAEADTVVCSETPHPFFSVSFGYTNFPQTTDEEVCDLLKQAGDRPLASKP